MRTKADKDAFQTLYFIAFIGFVYLLSRMTNTMAPQVATAIVIGLSIIALSFIRQDLAAIAIIFSMLLSPEMKIASLGAERDIVVRYEDIVIIVFFTSWLFKVAYLKRLRFLRASFLNIPILAYILAGMLATAWGSVTGDVRLLKSMFYFMRYIEYFMLFFMFSNIITTEQQLKTFLTAFYTCAVIVAVYGFYQIFQGAPRISAPFEGKTPEPNTYGGYLLIVLGGLIMGVVNKHAPWKPRLVFLFISTAMIVLLVATYSRASYLGFLGMGFMALLISRPMQRAYLVICAIVALVVGSYFVPPKFYERVTSPFKGRNTTQVTPFFSMNTRDSSYSKIEHSREVIKIWRESPIVGKGITAVGLVDTQYALILGETGLLGMSAFVWILWTIVRMITSAGKALSMFPEKEVWFLRQSVTGFSCSLFGLMLHSLGANTFIIVRIMEPFWFLTAVVAAIPSLMMAKKAAAEAEAAAKDKQADALLPGQAPAPNYS